MTTSAFHWPADFPYDPEVQHAIDLHLEEMATFDRAHQHHVMAADEDGDRWYCMVQGPGTVETRCVWEYPNDDVTCRLCGRAESVHDGPCGSFAERELIAVAAAVDLAHGLMRRVG